MHAVVVEFMMVRGETPIPGYVRVVHPNHGPAGPCTTCSKEVDHLEQDHTIPLCEGGRHHIDNLQWLCHDCHVAKTKEEQRRWREKHLGKGSSYWTDPDVRARLARAGRARSTGVKLNTVIAREIRESSEPGQALADRYGVALATIYGIRSGESWLEVM
jgi:endogenous inhibitor of DNA gyrase (YacG/DUF329 family)